MKASILTIGDEILYGDTIDTNSAFIGQHLSEIGLAIDNIISVSDTETGILHGLSIAEKSDVVIITGGLGPTKDDITTHTLSRYFDVDLKKNARIYKKLKAYYLSRDRAFGEQQARMAYIPGNATLLENKIGTAAGMWFYEHNTIFVSLPGVPYEMKEILTLEVIPRLRKALDLPIIKHRYFNTAAKGETQLAALIEDIELKLPDALALAYLPSIGKVNIRLTGKGERKDVVEDLLTQFGNEIRDRLGKYIYAEGDLSHEEALGQLLIDRGKTVSTAESCTGGTIASKITRNSGSSQYYLGSVVSYSNEAKTGLLGVAEETIKWYGAVSEQTAREMIAGALSKFNSDYAIAVTGIAGPTGGSEEKPVGTVWIAVGNTTEVVAKKFNFVADRSRTIEVTSVMAVEMLRRFILSTLNFK